MGDRVATKGILFREEIRTDLLVNGMLVQLMSCEDSPNMLYVILPDENGRLPMDADCAEPYNYQYEYAKLLSDRNEV